MSAKKERTGHRTCVHKTAKEMSKPVEPPDALSRSINN
jgi:hypothetical protein